MTQLSKNLPPNHSLHGHRFSERINRTKEAKAEDQKAKERNISTRTGSPDIHAAPKSESEGESATEKEGEKTELRAPSLPDAHNGYFLGTNAHHHASTMQRNGARKSLGYGSKSTRRNVQKASPKGSSSPLKADDDNRLQSWTKTDNAERPLKRARMTYGSASFKNPPKVEPPTVREKSPDLGFKMPTQIEIKKQEPSSSTERFVQPKTIDNIPKRPARRGRLKDEAPESCGSTLLKDFEKSRGLAAKDDILGSSFKAIPDFDQVASSNPSILSLTSQTTSDSTSHLPKFFDTEPSESSSLSSPISVNSGSLSPNFMAVQETANDQALTTSCPICRAPVSQSSLESFGNGRRLRIREQEAFCREHRYADALEICRSRSYTVFDTEGWRELSSINIPEHFLYLSTILKGEISSPYRDVLAQAAKDIRRLKEYLRVGYIELSPEANPGAPSSRHTIIPGFYGPKGQSVMSSAITSHFSRDLNRVAAKDDLVKKVGVAGFVQAVLVPELGVRLIMSQLRLDELEARKVLGESADIGALVNGEEDDVVVGDEDEKV